MLSQIRVDLGNRKKSQGRLRILGERLLETLQRRLKVSFHAQRLALQVIKASRLRGTGAQRVQTAERICGEIRRQKNLRQFHGGFGRVSNLRDFRLRFWSAIQTEKSRHLHRDW